MSLTIKLIQIPRDLLYPMSHGKVGDQSIVYPSCSSNYINDSITWEISMYLFSWKILAFWDSGVPNSCLETSVCPRLVVNSPGSLPVLAVVFSLSGSAAASSASAGSGASTAMGWVLNAFRGRCGTKFPGHGPSRDCSGRDKACGSRGTSTSSFLGEKWWFQLKKHLYIVYLPLPCLTTGG